LFVDRQWDKAHLKIFEGPLYNPGITSAEVQNPVVVNVSVKVIFDAAIGEGMDKTRAVNSTY
jgi:hypothetical protein